MFTTANRPSADLMFDGIRKEEKRIRKPETQEEG
jgi:hypothetical protein